MVYPLLAAGLQPAPLLGISFAQKHLLQTRNARACISFAITLKQDTYLFPDPPPRDRLDVRMLFRILHASHYRLQNK